jgi:hypothetical protein
MIQTTTASRLHHVSTQHESSRTMDEFSQRNLLYTRDRGLRTLHMRPSMLRLNCLLHHYQDPIHSSTDPSTLRYIRHQADCQHRLKRDDLSLGVTIAKLFSISIIATYFKYNSNTPKDVFIAALPPEVSIFSHIIYYNSIDYLTLTFYFALNSTSIENAEDVYIVYPTRGIDGQIFHISLYTTYNINPSIIGGEILHKITINIPSYKL